MRHVVHVNFTTPLVTFIIPTKGRGTLNRTLLSLSAQTKPNWRAIVICDGVGVTFPQSLDERVDIVNIPQIGTKNHAAQLRNFGMMNSFTEWVAFVDDDDTLASTYVQHLEEEVAMTPSVECVIFRMLHKPGRILPDPKQTNFTANHVGISFALRRRLYDPEGFMFVPGASEDFQLLDTMRRYKKKMVISRHTAYFVRSAPSPDSFLNDAVRATLN